MVKQKEIGKTSKFKMLLCDKHHAEMSDDANLKRFFETIKASTIIEGKTIVLELSGRLSR